MGEIDSNKLTETLTCMLKQSTLSIYMELKMDTYNDLIARDVNGRDKQQQTTLTCMLKQSTISIYMALNIQHSHTMTSENFELYRRI